MTNSLSKASQAVVACYTGSCENVCYRNSLVCSGKHNNHYDRTKYAGYDIQLTPDDKDKETLTTLVQFALSDKTVQSTYLNLNTQKAESVNHALIAVIPKSSVYVRNEVAKVHSVVHSLNLGRGESIKAKLKHLGMPVPANSRQSFKLDRIQSLQRYDRLRKNSMKYRTTRAARRMQLFSLHNKIKVSKGDTYLPDVQADVIMSSISSSSAAAAAVSHQMSTVPRRSSRIRQREAV
jgi:hypothetical protein